MICFCFVRPLEDDSNVKYPTKELPNGNAESARDSVPESLHILTCNSGGR
jgi:hypothetical protein